MPMLPPRRAGIAAFVLAALSLPAVLPAAAQAPQPPAAQAAPAPVEDPLRRETPRGAFLGFIFSFFLYKFFGLLTRQ